MDISLKEGEMLVTIKVIPWGTDDIAYRIEVDGEYLCVVLTETGAHKIRDWLIEHQIDGKSKFQARPVRERVVFNLASYSSSGKTAFDYAPWCTR